MTAEEIARLIARDVAELPDRTSPPDEPMLLLVTERELQEIVEVHVSPLLDALEQALAEARDWKQIAEDWKRRHDERKAEVRSTQAARAEAEARIKKLRPPDPLTQVLQNLTEEIALLSGRVELVMRTNARIIAKMDPGFLDDPRDPETKHRSDLLGQSVLEKLKHEALSQAVGDPETFNRLQRYFKGIP